MDDFNESTIVTKYSRFRLCGYGIIMYSCSWKCKNKKQKDLSIEYLCFYKVWEISVNLHVIDYDGNILDCANLAALCALAHFR